jgi:hypothetical protein
MPFEPLRTDEKTEGKKFKAHDMDALMLSGCSGFVGCSLITFFLGVWPFLLLGSNEPVEPKLLWAFPIGLIPALAAGGYGSRRFGLAAACGFIGGSMALTVFMLLISQRLTLAIFFASGDRHYYAPNLVYLIPVLWLVLAALMAYLFTPKAELHFWKP